MIGIITDIPLGRPVTPSPFGPNQPSSPTSQINETTSPSSVNRTSEIERKKNSSSAAIKTSAIPISGAVPVRLASVYSCSITAGDTVLTRSGPSSATANSSIRSSAVAGRSSPVSRKRKVEMATWVPSSSVPVIASRTARISGAALAWSIASWGTPPRSSTCSADPINLAGVTAW